MSAGEFLCQSIDIIEVAVRFVLVLLLQLSIIESLIIEFDGFGSIVTGSSMNSLAIGLDMLMED